MQEFTAEQPTVVVVHRTNVPEEQRLKNRAKVAAFEELLKKFPQRDLPVKHYFTNGLYAREMFAPAGTVAVGKIHRVESFSVISKGRISVYTEEGTVLNISAPYSWVAPPGTKRVAYFHEDTVWTCVYATKTTDLEELEKEIITPSFDDLEFLDCAATALQLEGE